MDHHMERIVKLSGLYSLTTFHEKQCHLIQNLLLSAPIIGNGLKIGGWKPVFQIISRLDELKMNKHDEIF